MTAAWTALRSLRRQPRPAAVSVLLLALGVGVNVVLFALLDAVLFKPYPFVEQDRLVIGGDLRSAVRSEVPYPDYVDYRTRTHSFTDLAAMASTNWTGTVRDGEPTPIEYRAVSGNFFHLLGVRAERGRTLTPVDDTRGAALVIVLSHAGWQRLFGGDPNVVGRSMIVDRHSHTIVGVMPGAVTYPGRPDGWVAIVPAVSRFPIPGQPDFVDDRDVSVLLLAGRLRDGVTIDAARRDLDRVARENAATFHRASNSATTLAPLVEDTVAPARAGLWALLAAASLLLAAAAANVAGLTLVRMSARRREFAIRLALGASPWDIARGLLVEAALLTGVAGACALVAARAALPALLAILPRDIPRIEQAVVGVRAVLYTLPVASLVVGVCGVLPALSLRRAHLEEMLRSGGRTASPGRSQRRSRRAIVAAEIAIAMVILTATALLYRSVSELARLDVGFIAEGLLAVEVHLPTAVAPSDEAGVHRFYQRVVDVLRDVPSVTSVAGAAGRPLKGPIGLDSSWQREGQDVEEGKRNPWANLEAVTPGYFETMGIRLLAGRVFTGDDRKETAPVAIVGATFAQRLWPGQAAVGRRIRGHDFARGAAARPWMTVVGVVADVRYRGLRSPSLDLYVPYDQSEFAIGDIVMRTRGPAEASIGAVRARLRGVDADGLVRFTDMTAEVAREQGPWRTSLRFFAFFAMFTTFLAVVGLYALLAAGVAEETHDVGVRLALGASAAQIAGSVLRGGGLTAIAGIAAGAAASLATGRFVGSMLVGVAPSDPVSLMAVAAVLMVLAALAALVPALRATRIDPLVALRAE